MAAALAAMGSVWYVWMRILFNLKPGIGPVLPGGLARYAAGFMMAYQLVM